MQKGKLVVRYQLDNLCWEIKGEFRTTSEAAQAAIPRIRSYFQGARENPRGFLEVFQVIGDDAELSCLKHHDTVSVKNLLNPDPRVQDGLRQAHGIEPVKAGA